MSFFDPSSTPAPRTPQGKSPDIVISHNNTSPIKYTDVRITSREAIESSQEARGKGVILDFIESHLTRPTGSLKSQGDDDLIQAIKDTDTDSGDIYAPLSELLTGYSRRAHELLSEANVQVPQSPIVFLDHHHHSPTHHPYGVKDRPDILGAEGPQNQYIEVAGRGDYREVPHYKVATLIECKPIQQDGRSQVASYVFQLLEARPDMPGAYVLWARPGAYQVLWSDASGVVSSELTPWDKLDLLSAYVYSLYDPPRTHFLRDSTVKPPTGRISKSEEVRWTIQCLPRATYNNCRSIFVGSSWGRRTNVWTYVDEQDNTIVIKDSYRDDRRRYKEELLLKRIHKDGTYPGVARVLYEHHDDPPITTAKPLTDSHIRKTERTKTRLVMGSYGESLRQAETVKDILMTIYDILEIHRGLVKDAKVLHRDISSSNIRMYPRHHPDTTSNKAFVSNPPIFIRQILLNQQKDEVEDNVEWNKTDLSSGLLIDFDNGAILGAESESEAGSGELTFITGTPMFICRSAAFGAVLSGLVYTNFLPMPELSPATQATYAGVYTQTIYDQYNDHGGTTHGGQFKGSSESDDSEADDVEPFTHRPDHDVESVFWVLLATLLRAQPRGFPMQSYDELQDYQAAYAPLANHVIQRGRLDDRDLLLDFRANRFRRALHPRLGSLGRMLQRMAVQIKPEYAHMDPPPPPEHLHEAMRRFLLDQILQMDQDPIELEPGKVRPYPLLKPAEDGKGGSKRKSGHDSAMGTGSKKTKGGYGDEGIRARHIAV